MSDAIKELNEADFAATVRADSGLVLIDFYADWCGPCKQMAPIIEDIAAGYADRLTVGQVDADAHPELAKRYGVRGLPTLLLLKGAVEVGRSFSVTKTRLAAMIESNLG